MEKLVILHTNDLHSHFENWPKIRRFMLGTRAAEQAEEASVLAFDDGDAMDRSVPLTEATDGQINIQLLNEIGYDAVTIGNNEASAIRIRCWSICTITLIFPLHWPTCLSRMARVRIGPSPLS